MTFERLIPILGWITLLFALEVASENVTMSMSTSSPGGYSTSMQSSLTHLSLNMSYAHPLFTSSAKSSLSSSQAASVAPTSSSSFYSAASVARTSSPSQATSVSPTSSSSSYSAASVTPTSSSSTPSTSTPTSTPSAALSGPSSKFIFSFKIDNQICSTGILENDVNDAVYKSFASKIIVAVQSAFKNDKTFASARVVKFDCGSVSPTVEVTKRNAINTSSTVELAEVKIVIDTGNFAGYSIAANSFSAAPAPATAYPNLYIDLKTSLSVKQHCFNIAIFKKRFTGILVTSDGQGFIKSSQVVFFENRCNDINAVYKKASPKMYISDATNDATKVDTELTTRASLLISQFIDDTTSWRLGGAYAGQVKSSTLAGKDKPKNTKLTELERVVIGMGVTFAVLLIIIIIILTVSYIRNKSHESSSAVTIENNGYAGETQAREHTHSSQNRGFAHDDNQTKVKIDEHDYEYPLAPTNNPPPYQKTEQPKGDYEELQENNENKQHSQPAMYQPLSATEESSIKVQVEPEVEQGVHFVSAVKESSSPEPRDLNMAELSERKNSDEAMRKEFESLEYNMPSANVYPQTVMDKNRLLDVLPRPETRVILSTLPSEPNADYINASFVRDQHQKKHYILAQSPLQKTAEDFWRMIYEQNVHVVVMVTPLVQLGMEKCFQYWPADSVAKQYGDISVQLKKKELKPDFTITTMALTCKDEVREMVLFRYMTWPEDNVPENVKSFVTFMLEARKANGTKGDSLLLIHCSNGVGISGSSVAIDIGIQSLEEKRTADVYSIVKGLRRDRAGAVQVFGEYKFIYKALYEYAVRLGADGDHFANEANATSSM